MRHSRRYREEDNDEAQIDISPLIDVVFILVIFFIVTTVFNKEVGVEINKSPRVSSSKNLERTSVMIGITKSGQVMYGGKNIGVEGVQSVINSVRDGGEPVPVIIIGDDQGYHGKTIKVINEATLAEAKSVSLATQK